MHFPIRVANASGRPGFALADSDQTVCERDEKPFHNSVERAEARLHFKGEAVRRVEDVRPRADCGKSPNEAGLCAVKVDDVGLELANEAPKVGCCHKVTQRGWPASHWDFREADAV
jgi:hypothetical protein